MFSKVIIGILVLLLIVTGSLCAYTFNLAGEIDALSKQLMVSQKEHAAQIGALSEEYTAQINALSSEQGRQISTLSDELAALKGETIAKIDTLDDELRGVASELERSAINASKLYQQVSKGIVRISDGEKVIGSGFAFDPHNNIITAQHVVEGQDQIVVILADGSTSVATVVGTCEHSDIAVLALEQRLTIQALTLADSETITVGEPTIVIGNPLNLPGTITSGVVSQTHRFVKIKYDSKTRWVASLVQFDAAVNVGNSGSPLLNAEGEVIGMVIARIDPRQGAGVYYAISSNKIKRVAFSLLEQGIFDYPWLGIEIVNLSPEMVLSRKLETANGALVQKIIADGPADEAGIEVNDVIVAIDQMTVREVGDITWYLGEYKRPDEVVTLAIIRDGTKLELFLKIGKREERPFSGI